MESWSLNEAIEFVASLINWINRKIPMTRPLDALEAEVLNLPALQRSHLLDRLITSLEADPEIEAVWAQEAERRDAEIEEGRVALSSGESVLTPLRKQLQRSTRCTRRRRKNFSTCL